MANRSKILDETAESINSAVRALNSLSDVIDGSTDNPLKIHGCKGAVRFLIDEGASYEELLTDVYGLVADDWEHIENNAARVDELKEFFKVYDSLRDAIQRFDNCYIDYRDKAESITGDSSLSQEYVLFVCTASGTRNSDLSEPSWQIWTRNNGRNPVLIPVWLWL